MVVPACDDLERVGRVVDQRLAQRDRLQLRERGTDPGVRSEGVHAVPAELPHQVVARVPCAQDDRRVLRRDPEVAFEGVVRPCRRGGARARSAWSLPTCHRPPCRTGPGRTIPMRARPSTFARATRSSRPPQGRAPRTGRWCSARTRPSRVPEALGVERLHTVGHLDLVRRLFRGAHLPSEQRRGEIGDVAGCGELAHGQLHRRLGLIPGSGCRSARRAAGINAPTTMASRMANAVAARELLGVTTGSFDCLRDPNATETIQAAAHRD